MKQHITKDQILSLSEEQRTKLREWVGAQVLRVSQDAAFPETLASYKMSFDLDTDEKIARFLTIGRMIEFFTNKEYAFEIASDLGKTWVYKFIGYENRKEVKGEVCNALWKLVREVLEEENK